MPRSCWGKSQSGMSAADIELWLPGKTTSSSRRPQSSGAPLQASDARAGRAGRGRPIHAMAATRTAARPSTTPARSPAPRAALGRSRRVRRGQGPERDLEDLPKPDEGQEPSEERDQERGGARRAGARRRCRRRRAGLPGGAGPRRPDGRLLEPGHEASSPPPEERSARRASGRRRGARARCRRGREPTSASELVKASHRPGGRPLRELLVGQRGHDRPTRRPQEKEHEARDQQVQTEAREGAPRTARQQDAGEGEEPAPEAQDAGQPLRPSRHIEEPEDHAIDLAPTQGSQDPLHSGRDLLGQGGVRLRERALQEHADVGHRDDHGPAPLGEEAGVSRARRGPHQGLEARRGDGAASGADDQGTKRGQVGVLLEDGVGHAVRDEGGDPRVGQAGGQPIREGVRGEEGAPGDAQDGSEAERHHAEADEEVGRQPCGDARPPASEGHWRCRSPPCQSQPQPVPQPLACGSPASSTTTGKCRLSAPGSATGRSPA